MGCAHAGAAGASGALPPAELHPWSVESGSASSSWDAAPDEEEVRVFYEIAVDRRTRRDRQGSDDSAGELDAVGPRKSLAIGKMKSMKALMGHALTKRPRAKSLVSRGSRCRSVTNGSILSEGDEQHPPKDYFLTADQLAGLAEDLGFQDLGRDEIARIYGGMPKDENGKVGKEQFAAAVRAGPAAPALRLLVQKLHRGFAYGFSTPEDYDFSRPSSHNYRAEGREFTDEFADLRRNIDYSYHNNYTLERQRWQDEVIKSTVVRCSEQPAPWLVFTCGPMGVGKGYCMNWMSKHGFFPLENIVHVDPDAFKLMMPEWPRYVKQSGEEAGTLCHMESSFMMEIAQWAAMQRRQNIWIDGSLRNASFYAQVFEDIRTRYPHYKISIMYIYADESAIRQRIKVRAERTGRSVPESLVQASLGAMDKALNKLTPLCDFVARINNSGEIPVLTAFETVDTKGSWSVLQDRFARRFDGVGEFPQFLAPLPLVKLPVKDTDLFRHTGGQDGDAQLELRLESPGGRQAALRGLLGSALLRSRLRLDHVLDPRKLKDHLQEATAAAATGAPPRPNLALVASPMSRITLSSHGRKLAGIPEEAEHFFWVFPLSQDRQDAIDVPQEEQVDPLIQFLLQGGFCYCSDDGAVLSVDAISHKREDMFLQFDSPEVLPRPIVEKMRKRGRFHQVVAPFLRQRGAKQFCWVLPDEIFGQVNVGGAHGAFVYLVEGKSSGLIFPVLSA